MNSLVTRFAPAPTGYLHLGHVLSAALVWAVGRQSGAKIILRIEDHDKQRSRLNYEQAIYEDLEWLGLHPDVIYRQSDRAARYDQVAKQLPSYFCECSRKDISALQTSPTYELRYPGTCRNKGLVSETAHGLRFPLSQEEITFIDRRHGECHQTPSEQCGDLLIRDRKGNYTYNFCVAVDDHDQGVNLVVRGDDILHCTGRQLMLRQALGNVAPISWFHHPLLLDPKGEKLGKRHSSQAIHERRDRGEPPELILGEALHCAGYLDELRPLTIEELLRIPL